MKRIALLSDTHSYIDDRILNHVADADEVWHAGDIGDIAVTDELQKVKPLKAVYGNIDNNVLRQEFEETLIFECEDVKVIMTHIGGRPGKYNARVANLLKEHQPKLFICGHSHILAVKNDPAYNVLFMNPGAVGKHGFHPVRTMLRFSITDDRIHDLEVIEYENRY